MARSGYPVINNSPWPVLVGLSAFCLAGGIAIWAHGDGLYGVFAALLSLVVGLSGWWSDVISEATYKGMHTSLVLRNERIAIFLFILSEAFFFVSFFWALVHFKVGELSYGYAWPPLGVSVMDPYRVPLFNLAVLLCSGATAQTAQGYVKAFNQSYLFSEEYYRSKVLGVIWFFVSIVLGVLFLAVQVWEYTECKFSVADSCYGSVFFVTTGFHGSHVFVGVVFLTVAMLRLFCGHFSKSHNFLNVWAAVWYWHFVDLIWVLLFVMLYWGSWNVPS
uniref:cytochrome c oxidase subunit III n=1 Tax=Nototeredo knoxi TaxID=2939324 RepID=UPI0020296132|nr:cytochrome c oxidase subunit III [Nototeredo knoxi]UPX89285.1 cytochrome c oxidase subunit 3 [Nototeredo knoxi]